MTTYFCDALKEVTILNGVARLEFQRFESVERGSNRELRPVTELIIALPMQGLVGALDAFDKLRDRLTAQGLIGTAAAPPPPPAKSPNFS